jgi:Uma2 family endonuclease
MAVASPLHTEPSLVGEKRVVFHHLTWQAYQQILLALGESRSARLTYDRGILEITMPSESHEFAREFISLFVRILVVEMGLKLKTMGSTTLERDDLDRGAEPDNCFYIQHRSVVAGKTVDLAVDPPPDLVVEVDITHTDIDKNALYASMGVPEFWRFNGRVWRIYHLQDGSYVELDHSPTFAWIEKTDLYRFLEQCHQDEAEAEIVFRKWVREKLSNYRA